MGSRVQLSVEQYFQNTCSAVSFEQSCIVRGEQTFQWELWAITIVAIVDTREIDREVFVEVASSHSSLQTYIRFRRRLERNQ